MIGHGNWTDRIWHHVISLLEGRSVFTSGNWLANRWDGYLDGHVLFGRA